jgi:hypothetical protein
MQLASGEKELRRLRFCCLAAAATPPRFEQGTARGDARRPARGRVGYPGATVASYNYGEGLRATYGPCGFAFCTGARGS